MLAMFFGSCRTFSHNCRFLFSGSVSLFVVLVFLTVSYGQRASETNAGMVGNEQIEGRVFFPPGAKSTARPVVKLQSLSSPEVTGVTDRDGMFRFTHLRPDQYTVVVEGGEEYERAIETVAIGNSGAVPAQGDPGQYAIPLVYQVQIHLKPKRPNTAGQPATANAVFANVPAPAQELFQQALESVRAGNHAKAIDQLKSVISQAPRFGLAYNELAVQYLKTGRETQAVETLKEGLGISPEDFTLRLNYGIALLNQKKFAAAETELRLAIQKTNADSPVSRFYLAMALIEQKKFDEAQPEFESAIKTGGDKLALAHKYLGGIYWRNKKYREAADELEKYLTLDPNAADAKTIRNTIEELRHKS
jgi:Tfp pilus assembly protein PilF/predicted RNA-binding protein with TRAM domain